MNSDSAEIEAVYRVEADLVDDSAKFFAPVSADLFSELLGQYQATRARIEVIADIVETDTVAVACFLDGNKDRDRGSADVGRLFAVKGAIASLNSQYWAKTLAMTDVFEMMPTKRREEWNTSIREMTTPDYTEESVRPTITDLLNMRSTFLAERVDGIFRGLSGEHVTNAPEAFGKRMIFAGLTGYGAYSTKGLLNDLRCVVAKFMVRDEPSYHATDKLVDALKGNWGQWITIDGGAMRIRLYMKGTAHMEIHPDMAWRLNSILANLYPLAIPAQYRQKPKKQAKTFAMMQRPLPFAVLDILAGMRQAYEYSGNGFSRTGKLILHGLTVPHSANKVAADEAGRVLESICGAVADGVCQFDYDAKSVIDEIVTSGCIPDQKSHQFYPTPESLARRAVELADIGSVYTVLEPSAGQGGLADVIGRGKALCVEISTLNCKVLGSKGHSVVQADFLAWATGGQTHFERVVMNPPFSEGRWQAHITAAAGLVAPGGVLVAILPASAKNKDLMPADMSVEWHGPFENEFSGTSVSVVILKATRSAA